MWVLFERPRNLKSHQMMSRVMQSVQLLFVAIACSSGLVLASTDSTQQTSLHILHIGDSFSAGNGAGNYHGPFNCYRSPNSWGEKVVENLKSSLDANIVYVSRACDGGKFDHMSEPRKRGDKWWKTWRGDCPQPEYPDEEYMVDTDLFQCTRYQKPQLEALGQHVDLVLLSVGGNDLGFSNVLQNCFLLGFRGATVCRQAIERSLNLIPLFQNQTFSLLNDIHTKLDPNSMVVLASYPHVSLDIDFYLDTYNIAQEVRYLVTKVQEAQAQVVAEANTAAGADYVLHFDQNLENFDGREPHPAYFTTNPSRWIWEFEGIDRRIWYHPNPAGHQNWGEKTAEFLAEDIISLPKSKGVTLDLAFVIDTTSGMQNQLDDFKQFLPTILEQVAASTDSLRVAVVSYRDSSETCDSLDAYASQQDLGFSTWDDNVVQISIDALEAAGGCDGDENGDTVFSGLRTALLGLSWIPGATKNIIVIGDSQPSVVDGGIEPFSSISGKDLMELGLGVDVHIDGVDVGNLTKNGELELIAAATGGTVLTEISDMEAAVSSLINDAMLRPVPWIGKYYVGEPGEVVQFDASGSFDPNGSLLSTFEWDFDGDGYYDETTNIPSASHRYNEVFGGTVIVRVTNMAGYSALASAHVVINRNGSAPQTNNGKCDVDDNGLPILLDVDGNWLPCEPLHLPREDQPGVLETSPLDDCFMEVAETCECNRRRRQLRDSTKSSKQSKKGAKKKAKSDNNECLDGVFEHSCKPTLTEDNWDTSYETLRDRWMNYCEG